MRVPSSAPLAIPIPMRAHRAAGRPSWSPTLCGRRTTEAPIAVRGLPELAALSAALALSWDDCSPSAPAYDQEGGYGGGDRADLSLFGGLKSLPDSRQQPGSTLPPRPPPGRCRQTQSLPPIPMRTWGSPSLNQRLSLATSGLGIASLLCPFQTTQRSSNTQPQRTRGSPGLPAHQPTFSTPPFSCLAQMWWWSKATWCASLPSAQLCPSGARPCLIQNPSRCRLRHCLPLAQHPLPHSPTRYQSCACLAFFSSYPVRHPAYKGSYPTERLLPLGLPPAIAARAPTAQP